ncbi:AAA+ ATPase domain-containing protein [Pseudoscourfieldia marina]
MAAAAAAAMIPDNISASNKLVKLLIARERKEEEEWIDLSELGSHRLSHFLLHYAPEGWFDVKQIPRVLSQPARTMVKLGHRAHESGLLTTTATNTSLLPSSSSSSIVNGGTVAPHEEDETNKHDANKQDAAADRNKKKQNISSSEEEWLAIFDEHSQLVPAPPSPSSTTTQEENGNDGGGGDGCLPVVGHFTTILRIEQEHDSLLNLLPEKIRSSIYDFPNMNLNELMELQIDYGEPVVVYLKGAAGVETSLRIGEKITLDDIKSCLANIGKFGPDHRAGIDGTLHRISCMVDQSGAVYALTMRVGRTVEGNVNMMRDLLFNSNGNILFLGIPGCGKTSVIREVTRMLAESKRVVIVDTSNEIAGDGVLKHRSVGKARRMMVSNPMRQERELIECVENHTPQVIVVDELGSKADVDAVSTVEKRGVRIIASAHGDLTGVLSNPDVNLLVGGVSTNVVGDELAKRSGGRKTLSEQKRSAIFQHVIELTTNYDEWYVHENVNESVKAILAGESIGGHLRRHAGRGGVATRHVTRHASSNA